MDRASLNWHEAKEFARYSILTPPNAAMPEGFDISHGGVPVAPVPRRRDLENEIARRRLHLPLRKRTMRRYSPDSEYMPKLFAKERKTALGMCSRHRREVPPHLRNAEERRRFWGWPGRDIYTAIARARHVVFIREAIAAGIVYIDSDKEEVDGAEEADGEEDVDDGVVVD